MIQAVIASKEPADSDQCGDLIHDGDCFIIGDAGKHGNTNALMGVFADANGQHLQKITKTLYVQYDEEDRCLTK